VLSVILRYADSDYPFGIFKLFLIPNNKAPEFTRIFSGDQFLWYIQHPPQNHSSCIYPPPRKQNQLLHLYNLPENDLLYLYLLDIGTVVIVIIW